jgi:autotransporter-associated beta strand protein
VYNWGYCIASANGFWLDQHNVSGTDYGGPLVPAAHDLDGNLVFNGNLTGDLAYSSAALGCDPGSHGASSPIQAVNDAVATLNNTVYSVGGSSTQFVNYLPLTFGYPMINIASRTGQLIFNLSHLTAAQQAGFTAAVAASYGSFKDSGGTVYPHVSTGSYVLDGQTYQWCTFGTVTLNFSDTIAGTGISGLPVPGVYYTSSRGRSHFTNTASKTNPYYQTNAATVQLTGKIAEPAGKLVVRPGWTLQLGSVASTLVGNTIVSNKLDDAFSAAAAPANSIELLSAAASTTDNVDGVAGQKTTLHGALVIDNPTVNVVLPNLSGGGWLVQSGTAKTTLAGTDNTFSGTIYLAKGTLAVAPGAHFNKAPVLMIGTNDASNINKPVFDISAIGTGSSFRLGELGTPGYQLQVYPNNYSDGLQYPTIALGSNTLIVGDGRTARGTYLGALTGTGGLAIAKGTTLTFGPIAPADVTHQNPQIIPISTFSGGITVDRGGALEVQTEGGFGTGPVTNAGTISLASGTAYTPTQFSVTLPSSDALPNHTLALPAGYTQASTGKLVLRVAQADAETATAAGAGTNYDCVEVTGKARLGGTLALSFINGYVPAVGSKLTVLSADGVTGAFGELTLEGAAGLKAVQHVYTTFVTVTFEAE